jgi:prenyltransferase beta subunit
MGLFETNQMVLGFQGRINKDPDTCYSFWIGATLKLLGGFDLVEFPMVKGFSLCCEAPTGGFRLEGMLANLTTIQQSGRYIS